MSVYNPMTMPPGLDAAILAALRGGTAPRSWVDEPPGGIPMAYDSDALINASVAATAAAQGGNRSIPGLAGAASLGGGLPAAQVNAGRFIDFDTLTPEQAASVIAGAYDGRPVEGFDYEGAARPGFEVGPGGNFVAAPAPGVAPVANASSYPSSGPSAYGPVNAAPPSAPASPYAGMSQADIDEQARQGAERAQAILAGQRRQQALDLVRGVENPFSEENMQRSQDAALLGMRVGQLGQDRGIYTDAAARGMAGGGQTAARGAALEGAQQASQALRGAEIFDRYTQGRGEFDARRAQAEAAITMDPGDLNMQLAALNAMRGDARYQDTLSRQDQALQIAREDAGDQRGLSALNSMLGAVGAIGGTILGGPAGGAIGSAIGQGVGALGSWAFPDDKRDSGSGNQPKSYAQGPTPTGAPLGLSGASTPTRSLMGIGSAQPVTRKAKYGQGWS